MATPNAYTNAWPYPADMLREPYNPAVASRFHHLNCFGAIGWPGWTYSGSQLQERLTERTSGTDRKRRQAPVRPPTRMSGGTKDTVMVTVSIAMPDDRVCVRSISAGLGGCGGVGLGERVRVKWRGEAAPRSMPGRERTGRSSKKRTALSRAESPLSSFRSATPPRREGVGR